MVRRMEKVVFWAWSDEYVPIPESSFRTYQTNVWRSGRTVTGIEFLILANHAEVRDGLLNLLGGGWIEHRRRVPKGGPTPISHFGIGVSVLVDWNDTNRRHHLTIRIENADGQEIAKIEGDVEVGRPPGIQPGSSQRTVLAFNVDTRWPSAGTYRVVARLGDQSETEREVAFRVLDQVG